MLRLARHLREFGCDVAVLAPHAGKKLPGSDSLLYRESFEGLPVFRLVRPAPAGNFEHEYFFSLKDASLARIYEDLMEDFRPDVVHILHLMWVTGEVVQSAKKYGARIFYTPTDFWPMCPTYQLLNWKKQQCQQHTAADCRDCYVAERFRVQRRGVKMLVKAVRRNRMIARVPDFEPIMQERDRYFACLFAMIDMVVPPNEFMKRMMIKSGYVRDDVPVIGFGAPVHDEQLHPPSGKIPNKQGKIRVGYCGTIHPSKGLHVLVEAIEKDPGVCDVLEFDLYGSIQDMAYFEDLKGRIGRLNAVRYCGVFASSEANQIIRNLDLLVVPSIWHENTPLIAYTALYNKTPLICSASEGLVDIVRRHHGGVFFAPGDSSELVSILQSVARDTALPCRWSNQIVDVKTSRDFAGEYYELYKAVIVAEPVAAGAGAELMSGSITGRVNPDMCER